MSSPNSISNLIGWWKKDAGLFTDAGGTVPVANDGDTIALWKDQSGNGNDLTQTTSANRLKWDALRGVVQNEYGGNQWMTLPAGAAFNSQAFTIGFIGQLVTLRDGNSANANNMFAVLLEGASDKANLYFRRGGRFATYDGTTVRDDFVGDPLLNTSPVFICMTSSASGTTIYVNGSSTTLAAMNSNSVAGGNLFGESASAAPFQSAILDTFLYGRALTSTEVGSLYSYAQTRGVQSSYTVNLLFDGDSLTSGAGNTMNRNWPEQMNNLPSVRQVNVGESGIELATLITDASTIVDPWILSGVQNTLVVFAGSNDFAIGSAAEATVLSSLKTYCTARKTAGWNRIIVCTMLPRPTGNTFTQANWTQFNADIHSSFAAGTLACDAIADLAADPRIGTWGANTGPYYAADNIHLNNAGSAIAAGIVNAAVGITYTYATYAQTQNLPAGGATSIPGSQSAGIDQTAPPLNEVNGLCGQLSLPALNTTQHPAGEVISYSLVESNHADLARPVIESTPLRLVGGGYAASIAKFPVQRAARYFGLKIACTQNVAATGSQATFTPISN